MKRLLLFVCLPLWARADFARFDAVEIKSEAPIFAADGSRLEGHAGDRLLVIEQSGYLVKVLAGALVATVSEASVQYAGIAATKEEREEVAAEANREELYAAKQVALSVRERAAASIAVAPLPDAPSVSPAPSSPPAPDAPPAQSAPPAQMIAPDFLPLSVIVFISILGVILAGVFVFGLGMLSARRAK